jgi:hypothetical protein
MTTREKLEALFAKVRAMPPRQQELVADALADLTEEPYQLEDDELELLLPELEAARRGEFCTQDEVDAVLRAPWRPTRS